MKKKILLFSTLMCSHILFCQGFKKEVPVIKYSATKVIDPVYGITMYEKLNAKIGGDSVRHDRKGYACQAWVTDIYESGKVLHKGYYEDGQLTIYKNFYESGVVERSFKQVDIKRCNMQVFYQDGKLKSEITYYDGNPQIWTDYYSNGQVEYYEENTKNMEHLIARKSYSENGTPQELFELIDAKKKTYSKKEYNESGKLIAEGQMRYSASMLDYQKDGVWIIYNEKGNLLKEKWVKGEQIKD